MNTAANPRPGSTRNYAMWIVAAVALIALTAILVSCVTASSHEHPAKPRIGAHWHFANTGITESSGVAASRVSKALLWTINDSGNDPVVYAFDVQGRDLGSWTIEGVRNRDWEALTLAPCQAGRARIPASRPDLGDCLFIADTGDNAEKYASATIYRVAEGALIESGGETSISRGITSLNFTYEDGPHDVEAMFMDAEGRLNFITKGRSNGVALYRLPADVWTQPNPAPNRVATRVAAFAIDPDSKYARKVNDASISPNGTQLAVRTYDELYIYDWSAQRLAQIETSGDLIEPLRVCDLSAVDEEQGEAITWLDGGTDEPATFILTSEGDGKISLINCPE